MNVDHLFDPAVGIRTTLSRFDVGLAESVGGFGFGLTGFTVRGFEADGNAQLVHVRGATVGLSVLKLLKADANISFQWEVQSRDNLNVLFGRPGINDFGRMVNRKIGLITDNPPDAASMRGLFFWSSDQSDIALQALFESLARGSALTIDALLAESGSWAVIEVKGSGLTAALALNGNSTLV